MRWQLNCVALKNASDGCTWHGQENGANELQHERGLDARAMAHNSNRPALAYHSRR